MFSRQEIRDQKLKDFYCEMYNVNECFVHLEWLTSEKMKRLSRPQPTPGAIELEVAAISHDCENNDFFLQ